MKMIRICCLLLLTVVTIHVSAQENQFIKVSSWNELLAQAKKERKMIFIDSYFVGCHPCKQMDDEVFPIPEVIGFMKDNFISTRIDFMTEELGKQLQLKYGVTGFPTFLVLTSEGKLVSRFSGYKEADQFQELLKEGISRSGKGKTMNGFSSSMDLSYPDFYTAMFKERKPISLDDLAAYLKGKDIFKEENAMPLLMSSRLTPELSEYLLRNYAKFEAFYGKEMLSAKRNTIIAQKIKSEIPQRDDTRFESLLSEMKALVSKEDWPYVQLDMAEAYYYRQLKDHKAFFKYAFDHPNDDDNKVRYMAMYLDGPAVDADEKKLFANWMSLVVREHSGYDVLGAAVRIMKAQNDMQKTKQYAAWGVQKAKLINKSSKYFQSFLD